MLRYKCLDSELTQFHNLALSAIQPDQIETIRLWRNSKKSVLRQYNDIEPLQQEKYFKESVWRYLDSLRPPQILLSVHANGTLQAYGGFVHISWENMRSEVSFLADPNLIEDSEMYDEFFSNFLNAIEEIATKQLGLHKLTLETFEFRKNHLRLIEQAGYVREGILSDHIFIDQQWKSSILHGKVFK